MFDMVDTAFSYRRILIICEFLQESSKVNESSLHVIWNAHTVFLHFVKWQWKQRRNKKMTALWRTKSTARNIAWKHTKWQNIAILQLVFMCPNQFLANVYNCHFHQLLPNGLGKCQHNIKNVFQCLSHMTWWKSVQVFFHHSVWYPAPDSTNAMLATTNHTFLWAFKPTTYYNITTIAQFHPNCCSNRCHIKAIHFMFAMQAFAWSSWGQITSQKGEKSLSWHTDRQGTKREKGS